MYGKLQKKAVLPIRKTTSKLNCSFTLPDSPDVVRLPAVAVIVLKLKV